MQKRYEKLFTDTILFAISNFGSKIITFLLVPLYTSVLSTREYGSADILTTTVTLLYPILTLSIYDATLRFALDKKYDRKAIFSASMLLMGAADIMLLLATPFVNGADHILGSYWWYFVGIFMTTSLQMCLSNYIKGCDKTKIFAVQGILHTAILVLLNIYFLLYAETGIYGYLSSIILACGFSCLYMILASKCYKDLFPVTFDKAVCKEMLSYSVPMIPSSVAWWVNASADKYMILGLIGVSANGLYGIAHKVPTIFSTFSNLFSQAWRISAISSYEETDKQAYYTKVYKMYSLTCIYGCIALTFASQLIAKLLFQAEYYQAWVYVPPLVIAALFEAYSGFLASIYAAAKKTKFLSVSTCIGAVINIVLNYALIKSVGAIGAPVATAFSFCAVWLMRLKVMDSFMPIKIDLIKSILSVLVVVISGLYHAFQGPFTYMVGTAAVITIIIINLQDTKNLFGFIKSTIRSITHKRVGGKSKNG